MAAPCYLADSALNAERFVDLPGLGTFYRSGDLARFDADGLLHFLGRDDQREVVADTPAAARTITPPAAPLRMPAPRPDPARVRRRDDGPRPEGRRLRPAQDPPRRTAARHWRRSTRRSSSYFSNAASSVGSDSR